MVCPFRAAYGMLVKFIPFPFHSSGAASASAAIFLSANPVTEIDPASQRPALRWPLAGGIHQTRGLRLQAK